MKIVASFFLVFFGIGCSAFCQNNTKVVDHGLTPPPLSVVGEAKKKPPSFNSVGIYIHYIYPHNHKISHVVITAAKVSGEILNNQFGEDANFAQQYIVTPREIEKMATIVRKILPKNDDRKEVPGQDQNPVFEDMEKVPIFVIAVITRGGEKNRALSYRHAKPVFEALKEFSKGNYKDLYRSISSLEKTGKATAEWEDRAGKSTL